MAQWSPEIPFWPQLPQLSPKESIIAQSLGLLHELMTPRTAGYGFDVKPGCIDEFIETLHRSDGRLAEENAAGFFAFEQALAAGRFSHATAVKGQIEGPITLAAYLFYRGQSFLTDPALFAAVAFHVSQMVCWQIERLRVANRPVIIFVDEPALCLEGVGIPEEKRLSALSATLADIRSRGAVAGLHCCAASPFERMCAVRPDILSFDAHQGLEPFFANREALAFVRRGGTVAYGLIPTHRRLEGLEAASIFSRWFTMAAIAGDPQELARQSMITATCGLGLLDAQAVQESFQLARGVARLFRKLAGVGEELTAATTDRSSS